MAQSVIMALFVSAERTEPMSDTSPPQQSKATPKKLPTTDGERAPAMLAMLQAVLADLDKLPALSAKRVNLYDSGQQIAGIVIHGLHWDDNGNLAFNEPL
jgi:hypothetical protein